MKYPDNERILIVRPCLKAICLGVRSASKLLSVILYRARNCKEDETTFTFTCTQADLVQDLCEELTTKQLHDMAIPVLQLLGYLDVNGSGFRHTYTVHLDKVQEALACYKNKEILELLLISFIYKQLEEVPMELELVPIQLEEVLKHLELLLKTIGKSSHSKRGRKPRPQAALEATSENAENQRDNIDSLDTKRESGAFAPADFLPSEDDFSEEDEPPPTVKMPAIRIGATNGRIPSSVAGNPPADRDSTSVVSRSDVSGSNSVQQPGRLDRPPEVQASRTPAALQVQPQTQEITSEQTSLPARVVSSPPTTQGSHEQTDAAATPDQSEPRASGEKPVQQALNSEAEGEKPETAKQKKARIERRKDEIIALHCQLLGRNVVRSKDEMEGARLMAESGATDAEIELTYSTYKDHKFWGPQLTLKNIAKLLDTTVQRKPALKQADTNRPAKAPGTTGFDIYKGNGVEEREQALRDYEERERNGTLLW